MRREGARGVAVVVVVAARRSPLGAALLSRSFVLTLRKTKQTKRQNKTKRKTARALLQRSGLGGRITANMNAASAAIQSAVRGTYSTSGVTNTIGASTAMVPLR
jgi:hypothetical protein